MADVLYEGPCVFEERRSHNFRPVFIVDLVFPFAFDDAPEVHIFFVTFVFLFQSVHEREGKNLTVAFPYGLLSSHGLLYRLLVMGIYGGNILRFLR